MAFYNEERDGKKLDEYLKRTRKAGVREIICSNIHGVTAEDHEKHSEYSLLDKDGNVLTVYGTHYYICFNGPYFDEHIKNIKAFFVKATYEAVKETNPNILLYCNNCLLAPDGFGSRTRDIEPYVDMIGGEGGFVWLEKSTTLWHTSPVVKMAETVSCGKPRVCFVAGDLKPWSYYMHTPCEIDIYYGQSIAYGDNVWFGLHGSSKQGETPGGKAAADFNQFIRNNNDYLVNTKSGARVALFWSNATATNYTTSVDETDFIQGGAELGSDKELKSNQSATFKGMFDILTRAHVQFDLIDETSFKIGQHKKYGTIIMSTAACISDEIAEIVKEYVKEGGKLISDFDTGLYNEQQKF